MTGLHPKLLLLFCSVITLIACQQEEPGNETMEETAIEEIKVSGDTVTIKIDLDSLFESHDVVGTIMIRRSEGDTTWVYNEERTQEAFLPASTFKVVSTLIGLETGVVNTEDTLFRWDGTPRRMPAWEADMTLHQAFHTSCVPCYQSVARKIGTERMNAYLTEFNYGRMIVTDETLDQFWLTGPSNITPLEQLQFLQRLTNGELAVSASSIEGLREVMLILQTERYQLYGKTGWSVDGRRNIGWFIGWYEVGDQSYLFVTNIEPRGRKTPATFASARHAITQNVMGRIIDLTAHR